MSTTTKFGSGLIQEPTEPLLHIRPLRHHNGKAHRVARDVVSSHAMGAENPLELSADAFERSAGTLVARVGVKADAKHLPGFESVRQHEQLGLGVGGGADGRAGQPGVTDLAGVGNATAVPCVALRPRPVLQVPEARRADDDSVIHTDNGERHRSAGVPPGEGGVDVAGGLDLALRDGTPLVEGGIRCRGGYQAVDMAVVERFEADVAAGEHWTFCCHGLSMRGVSTGRNGTYDLMPRHP